MADCDMCGKEDEYLVPAEVEGTTLNVCKRCAGYGKVVPRRQMPPQRHVKKQTPKDTKEIVQLVREDYAKIIKDRREHMGLKQKELAVKLAERESLIQKIETGQIVPSLALAEKIEKQLAIELIEQKELESTGQKSKPGSLTIGDMLKLK